MQLNVDLSSSDREFQEINVEVPSGKCNGFGVEESAPCRFVIFCVFTDWRALCAYNQPGDYIFVSLEMDGAQPLWPNSAMEKHIRPAALRAGIPKRIGRHTLRHTFGTLLKANGEDVATVQSLMRHANVSVTMDRYVQAVTPAKRQAQRGVVGLLDP